MKIKTIKIFLATCSAITATTGLSSCGDMLEMDSDRQVFDPALDQKTDSMYYTIGTLQGLQQAIDQYVLVNELRGDLLAPTEYADSSLTQLYNYTSTTGNKYDSAYVYYRVINNCNYYVAHRDTTLFTGSRPVAMEEYAEALAIRAWCYLQLAKTYGEIPFYTIPLDNISQADGITDKRDIRGICDALAPEMLKFVGTSVPDYGTINASNGKSVNSARIMFPVALVLADMYLESGRYEDAAKLYFTYLRDRRLTSSNRYSDYESRVQNDGGFDRDEDLSTELQLNSTDVAYRPTPDYANYGWTGTFALNPANIPSGEVITYVPMAVNKLQGTISALPALFGYNQFANENSEATYSEQYALTGSEEYLRLADSQLYYYLVTLGGNNAMADSLGDMRRWAVSPLQRSQTDRYRRYNVISKYNSANVIIYRTSVVYLRLAECLNRMGYPDAAFAVLKDGLGNVAYSTATTRTMTVNYQLDEDGNPVLDDNGQKIPVDTVYSYTGYITQKSYELLTTTLPFLTQANRNILGNAVGIHSHGCGYTAGENSLYQYQDIIDQKAKEMNRRYGLTMPETVNTGTESGHSLAVEIVEELICDEYALEAAFEGHRFGDLCRMARSKNRSSVFGANWGGRWLNEKLAFKHAGVDFSNERNWYMPFR